MAQPQRRSRRTSKLPAGLCQFFWDYDFRRLNWELDRDLIIGRILAAGDWPALQWLHRQAGHAALRDRLVHRKGAGLSPRQLRFWELILDIPHGQVNAWLAQPGRQTWDRRLQA